MFKLSSISSRVGLFARQRIFSTTAPAASLFSNHLSSLKKEIKEIDSQDLYLKLEAKSENVYLIDVRETYEWNEEHIPSAIYLGRGCLERDIESIVPDTLDEVIVYCASGNRSVLAADSLNKMGYKKVYSLKNGIRGWKEAGNEVMVNTNMYSPLLKNYE